MNPDMPDDIDLRLAAMSREELETFSLELIMAVFCDDRKGQLKVLKLWDLTSEEQESYV